MKIYFQLAAWKMHVGFGYEHVPLMLIEKEAYVFFGTGNGVVNCIYPLKKHTIWADKIDISMGKTVNLIGKKNILFSTVVGKLARLSVRKY